MGSVASKVKTHPSQRQTNPNLINTALHVFLDATLWQAGWRLPRHAR